MKTKDGIDEQPQRYIPVQGMDRIYQDTMSNRYVYTDEAEQFSEYNGEGRSYPTPQAAKIAMDRYFAAINSHPLPKISMFAVCDSGDPDVGIRASTDTVTIMVHSGDPGGEPGEFEQYMRQALADWFDCRVTYVQP